MEIAAVLAASVSLILLGQGADAHIHSQKVRPSDGDTLTLNTWLCALFSSALVGLCGVFPLVVNRWVRLDNTCKDQLAFRALLSFAVGGLLGDVFLHLLPEAYSGDHSPAAGDHDHWFGVWIGIWVLMGLLSFLVVEKVAKISEEASNSGSTEEIILKPLIAETKSLKNGIGNGVIHSGTNGLVKRRLGPDDASGRSSFSPPDKQELAEKQEVIKSPTAAAAAAALDVADKKKDISGYLNLVANITDNFTHGLAISASYVASPAVGMLTTLAILCHELPHEIGDFAILLKSGFSLKEAAKAQVLTASGGLVGVVAGLTAEHLSSASNWLLPFTAGGFLYIALVSIVPELLDCDSLRNSLVQLGFLGLGVLVMALMTIVEKKSCNYMPPHLVTAEL
jgi:zinc transporter ZupT